MAPATTRARLVAAGLLEAAARPRSCVAAGAGADEASAPVSAFNAIVDSARLRLMVVVARRGGARGVALPSQCSPPAFDLGFNNLTPRCISTLVDGLERTAVEDLQLAGNQLGYSQVGAQYVGRQ